MEAVRTYLEPTAPIATDAIVVDDPKLAMDLAVAVCDSPRMSNLAHGLWGYHGITDDGSELTVQSLGIGGPSAAIVIAELAGLGVSRAIRIGSCIALNADLGPGSSLIATAFEPADGAGKTLAARSRLEPDQALTAALASATRIETRGAVRSMDVVAPPGPGETAADVIDLASAAFAAASANSGITYAEVLIVAGSGLEPVRLHDSLINLGERAAAGLSAVAQTS